MARYIYSDVLVGLLADRETVKFRPGRIQTVRRPGDKEHFGIIIQIGTEYHIIDTKSGYRIQQSYKTKHAAADSLSEAMKKDSL